MNQLSRRLFVVTLVSSLVCVATAPAVGVEVPNLAQTLRAGLLPRTPAQREFLDLVVQRVNEGKLPLVIVRKAFLWARQQDTARAYYYFEYGVKQLAARDGIAL